MREGEKQQEKRRTRLHSEKQACPRRGDLTTVQTALSHRQTERDGKAFWDAKQSDRHLTRCRGSRVAREPRLSTGGERGHAGREKGSFPFCTAKLRQAAGSPRHGGVARVACRRVDGPCDCNPARGAAHVQSRANVTADFPGAALWWRSHSIGTAHAAHKDDSCEYWRHTPAAGSHQPLADAPEA
jgi:hypothetical protein